MSRVDDYRAALRALPGSDWADYLVANSGLPGPRGNLELLAAVVEEAPETLIRRLAEADDEYLAACGAAGMGRLLADGVEEAEAVMRLLAGDPRWRVREGVAIGLQRLGDADLDRMFEIADEWVSNGSWLVQRAALAGVCEPRLLIERSAQQALQLLEMVSSAVLEASPETRRSAEFRTLRQALGYCWSVVIAALPSQGFETFESWSSVDDPDIRWIIRENLKKKRLQRADPQRYRQLETRLR